MGRYNFGFWRILKFFIRVNCFTLNDGLLVLSFCSFWTKQEASMRKALVIAALALLTVASLLGSLSGTIAGFGAYKEQRVLATTVQMERLATKLEHSKTIAPETKLEITRLTLLDWSDCARAGCRKTLAVRNRTARERLQTLVTGGVSADAEPRAGR
jgi:hypothetical protein